MSSFELSFARSRFNLPTPISKFLDDKCVILKSFQVFGGYKSPDKFKIVIKNQNNSSEQVIALNVNEGIKEYFPHYIGIVINSRVEEVTIIGLTALEHEDNASISYSILFEDFESGGDIDDGGFPLYKIINPNIKKGFQIA